MTDKARELLERVIAETDSSHFYSSEIDKEIRAYLAQPEVKPQPFNQAEFDEMVRKGTAAWKDYKPEVKRETLSEEEIDRELIKNDYYSRSFTAGVRFAEKHHGIEKDVREETPD